LPENNDGDKGSKDRNIERTSGDNLAQSLMIGGGNRLEKQSGSNTEGIFPAGTRVARGRGLLPNSRNIEAKRTAEKQQSPEQKESKMDT